MNLYVGDFSVVIGITMWSCWLIILLKACSLVGLITLKFPYFSSISSGDKIGLTVVRLASDFFFFLKVASLPPCTPIMLILPF